jgi:ferritin
LILEHEIKLTKSINNPIDQAFNAKAFTTFRFMQWYVKKQETMSRSALELFDLIGEEGIELWTIDQELGKLHAQAASGE